MSRILQAPLDPDPRKKTKGRPLKGVSIKYPSVVRGTQIRGSTFLDPPRGSGACSTSKHQALSFKGQQLHKRGKSRPKQSEAGGRRTELLEPYGFDGFFDLLQKVPF